MFCPIANTQPCENLNDNGPDPGCEYSGRTGTQRCCSWDVCVSAGSCSGGDAVFCPPNPAMSYSSSSSSYASSTSYSSTQLVSSPTVAGCTASCFEPTSCLTCSGSSNSQVGASADLKSVSVSGSYANGNSIEISFCCDMSAPSNLAECRKAAGCAGTVSSVASSLVVRTGLPLALGLWLVLRLI